MEAAAKQVKHISQRILPKLPHQLSYIPDRRYRPISDARAPEEQVHRGLQYMTFVSDGDRGVLLTRSYDDMRDEPPVPSTNPPPVRSDKKPSTKISLSDYKNKVKQSQSPLPAVAPWKKADEKASSQERRSDSQPAERRKETGPQISQDTKVSAPRDTLLPDRPNSLPPKPLPPRDPSRSPNSRKRASDDDDSARAPKRSKPDVNGGAGHEKSRIQKDATRSGNEPGRKRDSPTTNKPDDNRSPRPESKPAAASSAVNGRGILKSAMNSSNSDSPNARARATSLNGSRPDSNGGFKSTLNNKLATSSSGSKSSVPPLLSPLNLSFDEAESARKKADKTVRRAPAEDNPPPISKNKPDRPAALKRAKLPPIIPPLLSPTLPPIVEAELSRRKKASSKEEEDRSMEPSRDTKTAKAQPAGKSIAKGDRECFIVTLKYPKRLAKRVQRILALPVKSERPSSLDPAAQISQSSKKRPLASSDVPVEISAPIATKKPRKSDGPPASTALKSVPPSTPSRPLDSASHVDTPGENGASGSSSQGSQKLIQVSHRYRTLGTKLKHARDDVVKNSSSSSSAVGENPLPAARRKLALVLGVESTLAYLLAFRALFETRRAERKTADPGPWKSLLPLMNELQYHARGYPLPHGLLLMLQDFVMQEVLTCFFLGPGLAENKAAAQEVQKTGSSQLGVRKQLAGVYRQLDEEGDLASLPSLNPGMGVEEVVCRALACLKTWAESEELSWTVSLSADEVMAGN